MTSLRLRACTVLLPLAISLASAFGIAQDAPATRVNRETMWFAPTAEDWKKPCLVKFQRTWDDAVALSKETGRAILICVNMDGEIASEHYAGVRYRQPEIARLYDPYVCVIASVYRHSPRDHDEQGRRVLCPRFGSVTCGEHIAIEPFLFEKFFDGRRVAPRHIGVELDGKEMYDVFYAWDTDTIFNSLKKGIADRPAPPPPVVKGDRSIVERVASPDNQDRTAVEVAFEQGDQAQRKALLDAAATQGANAPVGLLRMAISGFDADSSKSARATLAKAGSEEAVELIREALRVPMDAGEREGLVKALERIGETSARARTLAVVHRGLDNNSTVVDTQAWSKAYEASATAALPPPRPSRSALPAWWPREGDAVSAEMEDAAVDARVATRDAALAGTDTNAMLDVAEACISKAQRPGTDRPAAKAFYLDAEKLALEAEKRGASGWRVNGAMAVALSRTMRRNDAYRRAEAAMGTLPADSQSPQALAVLMLFAEGRQRAIEKAVAEKATWPGQWLTDVNATYAVIARHPFATDATTIAHYDFLRALGADGPAARVLDDGLARFPDSGVLHNRLRCRVLAEKGVDGLEPTYEAMLKQPDAPLNTEWFAGYASILAAEYYRRSGKTDQALAAYERAVAHYEKNIEANPDARPTADESIVLAFGGRARIALERKDFDGALNELLKAFARKPEAAATLDGLNISPVDTAKMLLARAREAKRDELVTKLDAELRKLDPKLLQLPAYERETPASAPVETRPSR